jgi:hypothetical protein
MGYGLASERAADAGGFPSPPLPSGVNGEAAGSGGSATSQNMALTSSDPAVLGPSGWERRSPGETRRWRMRHAAPKTRRKIVSTCLKW